MLLNTKIIVFKSLDILKYNPAFRSISTTSCKKKFRNIDKVIPKNVFTEGLDNNNLQVENGHVYDTKPFRLRLEKDKLYAWCLCGLSRSQPLCDNSHKIMELHTKLKPIYFKVEETKDYWLCNCKHTSHRPFCDGSHIAIQEERKAQELEKQKSSN